MFKKTKIIYPFQAKSKNPFFTFPINLGISYTYDKNKMKERFLTIRKSVKL